MLKPTRPEQANWARTTSGAIVVRAGRIVTEGAQRLPVILRSGVDAVRPIAAAGGGALYGLSFLALVVAPTILFLLYTALWQTRSYVAEARLAVRGAQEQKSAITDASSIIGKLTGGGGSKASAQDSYIALNYIKSPALIEDLGGRAYMEKYFGLGSIDFFSRLKGEATIEELHKYWLRRMVATVDTVSGILTMKIEAFRAEDSTSVANDVIRLTEALINQVTIRNRKDAVDRDEREVGVAAEKLAVARDALTVFRQQNVLIDPGSRAQSIGETIGKLTMEKIGIENSLATLKGVVNDDSPTQRIQRSKLAAIDQQIAELKKNLTDPKNDTAVSAQIASYERLKLSEMFAEKMYTIAQVTYEKARQELERQQLYLVVVVAPVQPEEATYPKIFGSTLLLFAMLTVMWSIGALIAASVGDHMT